MGMPPVRRAFFILFIAAGVVAAFLLLAQDQVTLKTRSAVGAANPGTPNYLAGLLGVDLTQRQPLHASSPTATRSSPRC